MALACMRIYHSVFSLPKKLQTQAVYIFWRPKLGDQIEEARAALLYELQLCLPAIQKEQPKLEPVLQTLKPRPHTVRVVFVLVPLSFATWPFHPAISAV